MVFDRFLSLRLAVKWDHLENDTLMYVCDWADSEKGHRGQFGELRFRSKTKAGPLEDKPLSRAGNIALVR